MLTFKIVDQKTPKGSLAQFLANRTFPASYQVLLVNESDRDLANIELSTGGFDGTGDELVGLNWVERNLGPLKHGGSWISACSISCSRIISD